jgi:hydrogenase expression/formation protein HypE
MTIAPANVRPGDTVLVSGDLGRHGIAVMSAREGIAFETSVESDCAPLNALALELLGARIGVHCMRDLTRGGLASALNEIAAAAELRIELDESAIPVSDGVRGACELLGLDPLYVACEGRCIVFVDESHADRALALMRTHAAGISAVRVGNVTAASTGRVTLKTRIGSTRIVDMLSGEQLPRIC